MGERAGLRFQGSFYLFYNGMRIPEACDDTCCSQLVGYNEIRLCENFLRKFTKGFGVWLDIYQQRGGGENPSPYLDRY